MATEQLGKQRLDEQQRVLSHVSTRLAERFPDAPPAAVGEAVHRAWTALSDAKVREFVEIFVERDAAAMLASFSGDTQPPEFLRVDKPTGH